VDSIQGSTVTSIRLMPVAQSLSTDYALVQASSWAPRLTIILSCCNVLGQSDIVRITLTCDTPATHQPVRQRSVSGIIWYLHVQISKNSNGCFGYLHWCYLHWYFESKTDSCVSSAFPDQFHNSAVRSSSSSRWRWQQHQ
jgi:hypothetical protein